MRTLFMLVLLGLFFINKNPTVQAKQKTSCNFNKDCKKVKGKGICAKKKCFYPGDKGYCSVELQGNELSVNGHVFARAKKNFIIRHCWTCAKNRTSKCIPKDIHFQAMLIPKQKVELHSHGFILYADGMRIQPRDCKLKNLTGSNLITGRFKNYKPFKMFVAQKFKNLCKICTRKQKTPLKMCTPVKYLRFRGKLYPRTQNCEKCKQKDKTRQKWRPCTKITAP